MKKRDFTYLLLITALLLNLGCTDNATPKEEIGRVVLLECILKMEMKLFQADVQEINAFERS